MLRPFQVNEGRFLAIEHDLLPTARVSELCSAVKAVSNESEEDQVMLTSEGKQMDPAEMIGAYSVGTESKPIFVFYRSYLTSPHPPSSPSRLPQRGELKQQLELLNQKPTPSLFQKMVLLAKRLSEYVVNVGSLCGQLSEEYQLQYSGWCTALANCDSIVRTYQKHHQLFSKEVETFKSTKPEYLQLMQEFPEKVELLQQLPMPSTLQEQNENPASSLYDWISTHDERNSLLDLSRECKKSLSNLDSTSIDAALSAIHQITEEATKLHSQDEQFRRRVKELTAMTKKTTELTNTTTALAQNIQSTSERARRYGDAGTIADLVVSHHRSLQMMSENNSQLEGQAKEAEQSKVALTRFIHTKLQQVAKLQERVAYSNSQLLLLHEHIKLARKRFEVLRQICHTPQVLAHVLSEVDRRTAFNSALEKRAEEVSVFLKQAREEEKQLRRSFVSNYGQHFIATLFPELIERVPDVSIHLPRSLSKSSQSYHSDLERIRQHLPLEMRPSPASASIQLLSSPLLTSLAVGSSPVFESARSSSSPNSESGGGDSSVQQQLKESSVQTGGSLGPNEEKLRLESLLQKLEAANSELGVSLSTCVGEREHLKQRLEEKDVINRKMVTSLELDRTRLKHELTQLEDRNRELSSTVDEKERLVIQLESAREGLLVRVEQTEKQSKRVKSENCELERKVQLAEEETKALRVQISRLSDERERHTSELKQKVQETETLELRYNELSRKYESEIAQLQDTVTKLNRKLSLQSDSSVAEITQLKERISQLESTNKDCLLQREVAKTKLSDMKAHWEEEKRELESKLTRISTELQQCQTENETLTGAAGTVNDALQLREREISQLRHEVQEVNEQLTTKQESLLTANQELEERCKRFEGERSRQELRHQQAQSTISDLKVKMEAAESKARDCQNKLEATKKELSIMQDKVQASEKKIEELQSQNSTSLSSTKAEKAKNAQLQEKVVTLQETVKTISSEYEQVKKSQQEKVQALEQRLSKEIQKYDAVKTKWEEAESLAKEMLAKQNSVERQLNMKSVELESVTTEKDRFQCRAVEYEAELKSITDERDLYHRQAMELERDLKELRREIESPQQSLVAGLSVNQSTRVADPQNLTATLRSVTVSIASIKDGDVALFVNDSYGNYLALAFDKIYYLNDGSVQKLNDLSSMVPRLDLKRNILIGKVTGRMHVEVRKEGNRLKVPVGTRMYKIDAEPVLPLISATAST